MRRVRFERGEGDGEARAAILSWACVGRDDILDDFFVPLETFLVFLFSFLFSVSLMYKVYPAGAARDAKHFPGWDWKERRSRWLLGGCRWRI